MTTDEKAKAYEMALEAARKELGVDRKEWEVVQRVLHNIFPQLRESEDERIRKFLIGLVSTMNWRVDWPEEKVKEEKVKCIAWLEKQKEPKKTDLPAGFYYIDLDGNKYYSKEFRYGDMKLKVATATLDAEKQKELMPPVNVDPCDASCDAYYQRGLNKGYELGLEAGRKEQKPADLPAGFYVTLPDGKKYYTKEMRCNNMKVKVVTPQPSAWSEEDKRAIDRACVALRAYANGDLPNFLSSELIGYADRLQSLRPCPSWKPSEEQIEALKEALETYKGFEEYDAMKSLYDDLKKL